MDTTKKFNDTNMKMEDELVEERSESLYEEIVTIELEQTIQFKYHQ